MERLFYEKASSWCLPRHTPLQIAAVQRFKGRFRKGGIPWELIRMIKPSHSMAF